MKDPYEKPLLSSTIKNFIGFLDADGILRDTKLIELKNEIKEIEKWESKSIKIILSQKEDYFYSKSFIFYVNYIDDQWYLTIIDFASNDCSV